ncbi:putative ribosomal N-acetyltransferase YdaF [compost metagenome]
MEPRFQTNRLTLRLFEPSDALLVQALAGSEEVARTTLSIPHPYRVLKSENQAELGYWVGRPFWGQGYATEAAQKIVKFGFEGLRLDHIFAAAMTKNPASYKVMQKIGMKPEDNLPKQILKSGMYEDLVHYGMVKSEIIND